MYTLYADWVGCFIAFFFFSSMHMLVLSIHNVCIWRKLNQIQINNRQQSRAKRVRERKKMAAKFEGSKDWAFQIFRLWATKTKRKKKKKYNINRPKCNGRLRHSLAAHIYCISYTYGSYGFYGLNIMCTL